MATHSSVLAWRIPGAGEPSGLPSMGSHRVGHDWSDLAAARRRILLTSVPKTWVPKVQFKLLTPQGESLSLCNPPSHLCPSLQTQSQPDCFSSLPTWFVCTSLTVLIVYVSLCQSLVCLQWELLHAWMCYCCVRRARWTLWTTVPSWFPQNSWNV